MVCELRKQQTAIKKESDRDPTGDQNTIDSMNDQRMIGSTGD